MEKRFSSKSDDSHLSEATGQVGRIALLVVSVVLIFGIAVAAVVAGANYSKVVARQTETEMTSEASATESNPSQTTETKKTVTFRNSLPKTEVPADSMQLKWGMSVADIKTKYYVFLSEEPSTLADEKDTVNITYELKGQIGGFDYTHVILGTDTSEGLYAFTYLFDKSDFAEISEALTDEYGRPKYRSDNSIYWDYDDNVLMYLTMRLGVGGRDYTLLQFINVKEPKASEKNDKSPVITLGMTIDDVKNRKLTVNKLETSLDGTETYMSEKSYDVTSDDRLGKFAPTKASKILLFFDPRADLTSYSFVIPGDFLYEIREKLATEYGSPQVNRDYSSQWNTFDGKATVTVTYGRMSGSGRGFATEIRYSCTPSEYQALEMIKAVGRATRKGMKYTDVKNEIGKYNPSEKINKKGTGTMTLINSDNNNILIFGVRIRSVEIEFVKNKVTEVYYIFDGGSYDALKRNIETNYGGGSKKNKFKDRIKRVLWQPKTTDENQFSRLMLDYLDQKTNPKCRVHYYD